MTFLCGHFLPALPTPPQMHFRAAPRRGNMLSFAAVRRGVKKTPLFLV